MIAQPIEDRWNLDEHFLRKAHEEAIDGLKEVDDVYANHREIVSDFFVTDVAFHYCPACGWWCIIRQCEYDTAKGMPYVAYHWAAGTLAGESFPNIDAPVAELRSYLCARYDDRFLINPFRLEDVIASIFRSFGARVSITQKSHDGGIDIFGLDAEERPFGIQVKRWRQHIGVEQIRAFLGALLIHDQPKGVFVTTSEFTSGAFRLCQRKHKGIELEPINAARLFDLIKVAQIKDFDESIIPHYAEEYTKLTPTLHYGYAIHMHCL